MNTTWQSLSSDVHIEIEETLQYLEETSHLKTEPLTWQNYNEPPLLNDNDQCSLVVYPESEKYIDLFYRSDNYNNKCNIFINDHYAITKQYTEIMNISRPIVMPSLVSNDDNFKNIMDFEQHHIIADSIAAMLIIGFTVGFWLLAWFIK
jgi:spore coat polysaccharide biosynthesis predicted glycosyltransferase SpsG